MGPEPPCLVRVSGHIFSFLFPLADDASEASTRLQTQRWLESLETDLNLASSDANAGASAKRPLDVKNLLGQQGSMPSSSVSRFSSSTSSGGSSCGDVASLRRPSAPTPSDVLEHIHARFSELAATTMAVANSAVTSETEARRYRTGGACCDFGVLVLVSLSYFSCAWVLLLLLFYPSTSSLGIYLVYSILHSLIHTCSLNDNATSGWLVFYTLQLNVFIHWINSAMHTMWHKSERFKTNSRWKEMGSSSSHNSAKTFIPMRDERRMQLSTLMFYLLASLSLILHWYKPATQKDVCEWVCAHMHYFVWHQSRTSPWKKMVNNNNNR